MGNNTVLAIMGPTATGKTDAAARCLEHFDAEIISVDSSLVYRGMDIGTAKPDEDFLRCYPHHLVDIRDPWEQYSVAEFYKDTRRLISAILARKKTPILVGGTQFYFHALEKGLPELPSTNIVLRKKLQKQAQVKGWNYLYQCLQKKAPKRAQAIHHNDKQRILRALEILEDTGEIPEKKMNEATNTSDYNLVKLALVHSDRSHLHEKIATRFDTMLSMGFEQEVSELISDTKVANAESMKMIGYRQMQSYLKNEISFEAMKDQSLAATRQLAKRQLTWLRNQSNVIWWVDYEIAEKKFSRLSKFLQQYL